MQIKGQKVMLALGGTENFLHANVDDFIISLRTFEGGIERCRSSGCVSPAYTVLKPSRDVDARFFTYLLKSTWFISVIQSCTTGIRDGKTITYSQFASLDLPLPSLLEQRAIADFLDRKTAEADALVAKYERLIELLEEKRVALITQAVTKGLDPGVPMKDSGIAWADEIPSHWVVPALGQVAEVVLGKMRAADSSNPGDVLAPYLKARNVTPDKLDCETLDQMWCSTTELAELCVRPGDIIVCEGGVTFGRSAIASGSCPDRLIFEKSLHRIRTSPIVNTAFLNYSLMTLRNSGFLETIAATATFMHFTREKLVAMRFPIPPIDEQREIVDFVEREKAEIGKIISKLHAAVALVKEHRSALITAAATGQIDVNTYRSTKQPLEVSA